MFYRQNSGIKRKIYNPFYIKNELGVPVQCEIVTNSNKECLVIQGNEKLPLQLGSDSSLKSVNTENLTSSWAVRSSAVKNTKMNLQLLSGDGSNCKPVNGARQEGLYIHSICAKPLTIFPTKTMATFEIVRNLLQL